MRQQQAIGALLICLITVIITCAVVLIPRCFDDGTEVSGFAIDSVMADSLQRQWEAAHPSYKKHYKRYPKYVRADTVMIEMQRFDPNTADSLTLLRVGLKPWQAKGILHYRAKGGRYRKPEDLKKLYGMNDSMFALLEPWIEIAEVATDSVKNEFVRVGHEKRDTILELNRADSLDLQYIRGIGPYLAKQIVLYRQKLGGYADIAQLAEIKGISAESDGYETLEEDQNGRKKSLSLDSLRAHLTIDVGLIRVIQVNHASVGLLAKHPYISYDQARALNDLRHRRTIRSEDDLIKYGIFSRVELERLRPYLRYDK